MRDAKGETGAGCQQWTAADRFRGTRIGDVLQLIGKVRSCRSQILHCKQCRKRRSVRLKSKEDGLLTLRVIQYFFWETHQTLFQDIFESCNRFILYQDSSRWYRFNLFKHSLSNSLIIQWLVDDIWSMRKKCISVNPLTASSRASFWSAYRLYTSPCLSCSWCVVMMFCFFWFVEGCRANQSNIGVREMKRWVSTSFKSECTRDLIIL